jgi:acyl-CoA thioester hydrolase
MTAAVHRWPLRVYYEDTDAAGIVYHASYLKFAERGRTEMLRALGFDHRGLAADHGIVFAVSRCVIDFVGPGRLDDLLQVTTRPLLVGGVRLELEQVVTHADQRIARLEVTLATLDSVHLRPKRLPEALRQAFLANSE